MTPPERAEKIYQKLLEQKTSLNFSDPTDFIAAQIEEAVEEDLKTPCLALRDALEALKNG